MSREVRRSPRDHVRVLAGALGAIVLAAVAHSPPASAATCPLAIAQPVTHSASPPAPEDGSCLINARAVGASSEIYDLRSRSEYLAYHVSGARHSSAAELPKVLPGTGNTVVVYDSGKFRSDAFLLCERLRSSGLKNFRIIDGGVA